MSIAEVARAAGVSTATVSRVMRDVSGVSERTRQRVRAVAADFRYEASPSASRLATGRTGAVGIVVPYVTQWFFAQVIHGAEQVLRQHDLDVLLYNASDTQARARVFEQRLLHQRVDAVLVLTFPLTDVEEQGLRELNKPVAIVGASIADCASVRIDDFASAGKVVQHLINLGHEHIGLISGHPDEPMGFTAPADRRRGWREVLIASGLELERCPEVYGDFTVASGAQAMAEMLSQPNPPTAVFAESDEMAVGAIRTLRRAGLAVPADMSVAGFDDHELADLFDLTTVAQPAQREGRLAAEYLIDALDHGAETTSAAITIDTQLMIRGSTSPPATARRALEPEERPQE